MKRKLVKLEVTDKDAVYVNDERISFRSTKWAVHNIVFETQCEADEVTQTLEDSGYGYIQLNRDYTSAVGVA